MNKLKNKKKEIIHLIHCNRKGGVEVGALKAQTELKNFINYKVKFIYKLKDNNYQKIKKGILLFFALIKINRKVTIITSLWFSHLILFFVTFFNKNIKWISFIHNSNYPSFLNKFISVKITLFSDQLVFDSYSTGVSFLKKNKIPKKNIINYYFKDNYFPKVNIKNWKKRIFDFIIVARNINQKGFFELEKFFSNSLKNYQRKPKILIITDDLYKEVNLKKIKLNLKNLCDINIKLNLDNKLVLKYLSKSKYYLCLSKYEGFAITIAEALHCGCFIITTNVGEQKNYLNSKRKLILSSLNTKINFSNIEVKGSSTSNYLKSLAFFKKRVNFYSDQIIGLLQYD